MKKTIEPDRIVPLNEKPDGPGRYVLYWMQQSQRARDNPALEHAVSRANSLDLPVWVVFGLTDQFPEANLRHYRFMLEGLADTEARLAERGIGMLAKIGPPPDVAAAVATRAALVVCDVGYTRHQREWRRRLAQTAPCRVEAVEGDVVVPTALVSGKAEYAARTIRPKIRRHLGRFLVPCPTIRPRHSSVGMEGGGLDLSDPDGILQTLSVDRQVPAVTPFFKGGTTEAERRLGQFVRDRFKGYEKSRSHPGEEGVSRMSPYLHFGQISPVSLALAVSGASTGTEDDRSAYLEELVVRRELACNFVRYAPDYDRFDCLPDWAKKTLAAHEKDIRPHLYDRSSLEAAETHDPYWNAAMREMRVTGYMHNYMRMYWGKKILEWSQTPQSAFETALALNNKYFLDGRDPNSYAGVGWVFGLHDRAWFERDVYGKVRIMTASGLERKFDMDAYIEKVAACSRKAGTA